MQDRPSQTDRFHQPNGGRPDPDPGREPDHRHQLPKRNCGKDKVCRGVQLCAKCTGTACFPGDGSVHHIGQPAKEICPIKAGRKYGAEHQSNTAKDTAEHYDVCELLFHRSDTRSASSLEIANTFVISFSSSTNSSTCWHP